MEISSENCLSGGRHSFGLYGITPQLPYPSVSLCQLVWKTWKNRRKACEVRQSRHCAAYPGLADTLARYSADSD
ncbi:hypothetical protein AAMO2058_001572700 [Amorphochlora amoebiformis]